LEVRYCVLACRAAFGKGGSSGEFALSVTTKKFLPHQYFWKNGVKKRRIYGLEAHPHSYLATWSISALL